MTADDLTPNPPPARGPVWVHGFDSDALQAAITAAAHAVQADAERLGHTLTHEQSEELAVTVISHYQSFIAGVHYATTQPRTATEQGR